MKFNATVTRCVSSSGSLQEGGKLNGLCDSTCRRGRSQSTRGIRKRCKIRAGWRHEWIPRTELPSRNVLAIHEVVRGPFSSPRLVSASPYVLVSSYHKHRESGACKSVTRCPRIKRGIPDPWAEYLAHRGFCSKDDQRTVRRDLQLGYKNIYITAKVWKDLGLPLGQGIPDPWKIPVGRKKWVIEKGDKPYREKRHWHKDRRYCRCCKRCEVSTQIPSPGRFYYSNKTALNVDPSVLNSPPQQEIKCGEVCQRRTLQQFKNFIPEAPNNSLEFQPNETTQECTAPCDNHPYADYPINVTAESYLLNTPPCTGTRLTSLERLEYGETFRGNQRTLGTSQQTITDPPRETQFHQTQVSGAQLRQEIRTTEILINPNVQTSEIVPMNSNIKKIKTRSPACACAYREQFPVQDIACACNSTKVREKKVGFQATNLDCTETVCNLEKHNLNHNLNVTQLPCGCVHLSPCIDNKANLGVDSGYVGFGSKRGASFYGKAFHRESNGQRYCECVVQKSAIAKPKLISRMKRLLNKCKPTTGPRHEARESQTVAVDTRATKISDEARLVCCQCSCPYLKVRNASQETPSKVVAEKKKKCVCARCIAKRERRENRRNKEAAVEEEAAWLRLRSHEKRVQVEPNQRMTMNCNDKNCRMRHGLSSKENSREGAASLQPPEQKVVVGKEESHSPSAPQKDITIIDETNRSCEVTKKFSADVNSLEGWQYPAIFGAPWYSSDSGENADVSEASRHTVQCTSMLNTSTEMPLVTSCTFIRRINHSTVFQCMKRHQQISKREEWLKSSLRDPQETAESESYASRKCQQRPKSSQTLPQTNGSFNSSTMPILKQIPLLDIDNLETQVSKAALPRIVCIDSPVGCVSYSEDKETSRTTKPMNRNEKREYHFVKCTKSKNKQSRKKSNTATVKGSHVDVDSGTIGNHLANSSSRRIHCASPRNQLPLEKNKSLTGVDNDKLILPDSDRRIQEIDNSGISDHFLTSSNGTHSLCDDVKDFEYEPKITTIVSPRKKSMNSSISCHPESCIRECRKAQVPRNMPTDDVSPEDQTFPTSKQNALVYRCELPSMQGICSAETSVRSDNTPESRLSTPGCTISSPAKMNGFFEGEGEGGGMGSFTLDNTEKMKDESPREFLQEVRTLVPNIIYQGGKNSSADNKCYLKYCSQRRSGPCIISSSNILGVQQSSYSNNENVRDDIPGMAEKEFSLGGAFSSLSNQRSAIASRGDQFACVSTHPLAKVQDKFNTG